MSDIKLANNAETTLAAGIDNSQLTIEVNSTSDFPTITGAAEHYFYATIIKQDGSIEIVKCTDLTGSTYTVTRGQDGTSGTAFSASDRFQLRLPKIIIQDILDILEGDSASPTVPAPAGTNMFFYQAAAPTNWTIYTTVEDCLLAVKGGSQDYNVAGGTGAEVGSWTPTTHTHTMNTHTHGYAHTHGQASHTHTMGTHYHTMGTHTHTGPSHRHTGPSHTHTYSGTTSTENKPNGEQGSGSNNLAKEDHTHTYSGTTSSGGTGNTGYAGTGVTGATDPGNTNSTDPGDTNATDAGSTNSQSTSTTDATDPGDTNASSAPSTDRPLAAVGILATKD